MLTRIAWRYRRVLSIFQRVRTSIALRGWRGTLGRISQQLNRRPAVDRSLSMLPVDATLDGLTLATSTSPRVSVIVPVYGNLDYTVTCLRSMAWHGPTIPFEVIVVDDASPHGETASLANVGGIRLLRNERNLGFVGSCNAGAAAAQGEFLVFLNNDTQVTAGWLEQLLHCFDMHAGCGLAGSRLVYPDGRLQEAGAWVFSDASSWNIGRFEPRDHPSFCFARQVDYVSGASLCIRRQLFGDLGGFDTRFSPGYYEDTDLAFAIRAAGMEVWYAPASVVIHAEGLSSAGTPETGMKRFQAINAVKFAEKWKDALAFQPDPGTSLAVVARKRYRGTVLVVDVATPDASRDSGSLRLITLMRLLVEEGWHVVFAPDDGRVDARAVAELGSMGIEIITRPWVDGIPSWLAREGSHLHAAILCRHTVAVQYAGFVRRHAPAATLIFDTVDLHFLREERAAGNASSHALVRQAETTRRQELRLIEEADITWVVSVYERELLARLAPRARVDLLSNIHEVYGRSNEHAGRHDLLFVGGFGHPPNADAMRWMASHILPALRAAVPGVDILVAGDVPEHERRALEGAGLTMLGRVPDLEPLMASALASIAPLRFGAGVKGKVNMAMSHGLPVIGTTIAVEGMQLVDGVDVVMADEPQAFVDAYLRLRDDAAAWTALSDHGLDNVRAHFSIAAARDAVRRALSGAHP